MEFLTMSEVKTIINNCGFLNTENINWTIDNYSNELIGYLGEHLKLTVQVKSEGVVTELHLFLKCIPRFDKWKAEYIRETTFFRKEYAMLNSLFKHFKDEQGERKWRPKLLYIKENFFVFEDVATLGYIMPDHTCTLTEDEVIATVKTVARFHAQSFIYEESKSRELKRPYRIWEDYESYLTEPAKGQPWRDTGERAVIDYLKEYSAYKLIPNFCEDIESVIKKLFERAVDLMKPSITYRNAVVHRDIWSNNIFFKKLNNGKLHALIVDFQTVVYCSPMLDLSSLLFFNTTKSFRSSKTNKVLDFYYNILEDELKHNSIDISSIINKHQLKAAYEESIVFGITQAAIIVPIIAMTDKRRNEIFGNYENAVKVNVVSRSGEFIETAIEDKNYRNRVSELLDEIVERYVYPSSAKNS